MLTCSSATMSACRLPSWVSLRVFSPSDLFQRTLGLAQKTHATDKDTCNRTTSCWLFSSFTYAHPWHSYLEQVHPSLLDLARSFLPLVLSLPLVLLRDFESPAGVIEVCGNCSVGPSAFVAKSRIPVRPAQAPQQSMRCIGVCAERDGEAMQLSPAGRGCVRVSSVHMLWRVTWCWYQPSGDAPRGPLPQTARSYRRHHHTPLPTSTGRY